MTTFSTDVHLHIEPTRRRNACSNCREHGHTIKKCTHPSVQALHQELQHAIHYSIGYDHQAYIEEWLSNLNVKQLRILAYKYNITTHETARLHVLDNRLYYIERLIDATYTSQPRAAIDRRNARDRLSGEQLVNILETIETWVVRNTLLSFQTPSTSSTPVGSGSLQMTGNSRSRTLNIMQPTPIQTIYHQSSVIRRNIRDVNARRTAAQQIIVNAQAQIANIQTQIANVQTQLNEINITRTHLLIEYNNVEDELNQFIENIDIEPRKFDINMVEASVDKANDSTKANDCPICYEAHTPEKIITTNCNHTFCSPCLVRSFEVLLKTSRNHPTCAMCREPINKLTFYNNPVDLKEMQDKFCVSLLL